MDYEGVEELRKIIKSYARKNHITMLVTSHNKEDIEVLSDIVLELKKR